MNKWLLAVLLIVSLMSIQSAAAAKNGQSDPTGWWKNRIAMSNPLFADWKDATVRELFHESTDNDLAAVVWHVEKQNRNLGYFVASRNGQVLLEYSPITPMEMLKHAGSDSYVYVGPGMHLLRTEDVGSNTWINLSNGETVSGTPIPYKRMQDNGYNSVQGETGDSRFIAFSTDTNSDSGVAVMIQHGLGNSIPFGKNLLPKAGEPAGYLVFTAFSGDYYSVLAITGLQTIRDTLQFLEVRDVFAGAVKPLYIAADAAVNWVGSR